MENNQEHKIDKIFRETFENQSFTPPTDAWMGIHTYTIGQEESKKKIWLRYASLALLFLLVSGLGIWYFVDNQVIKLANNSSISPVAGLPTSPLVHKHTQKSILPTTGIAVASISPRPVVQKHIPTLLSHELLVENTNNGSNIPTLLTPEVDWSGDKPQGEEVVVSGDTDHGGSGDTDHGGDQPWCEEVVSRDDHGGTLLSHELLVENTNNGDNGDKKEIYKSDSVVYGKGFSLKHPIISFGIFGTAWNFWNFGDNVIGRTYYPNERNSIVKLGIAWKVNKKLRVGISLGTSNNNLGVPGISIQPGSSSLGWAYARLIKVNSDQYYQTETPFGYVNIPISKFQNSNPIKTDSIRFLTFYERIGLIPHSMQTTSLNINSQFDLFNVTRKKGKHYNYQIYGLTDINIQRQTSYFFNAIDSYYNTNTNSTYSYNIYVDNLHLQNASEYVFGLRAGLGFRYQFARKWDFYVEGSGQHSLNNWVKSDDIKTFQRTLSLQAGINLNL
jgi:hypothetical protein